jgi:hypothetical protein
MRDADRAEERAKVLQGELGESGDEATPEDPAPPEEPQEPEGEGAKASLADQGADQEDTGERQEEGDRVGQVNAAGGLVPVRPGVLPDPPEEQREEDSQAPAVVAPVLAMAAAPVKPGRGVAGGHCLVAGEVLATCPDPERGRRGPLVQVPAPVDDQPEIFVAPDPGPKILVNVPAGKTEPGEIFVPPVDDGCGRTDCGTPIDLGDLGIVADREPLTWKPSLLPAFTMPFGLAAGGAQFGQPRLSLGAQAGFEVFAPEGEPGPLLDAAQRCGAAC